MTTVHDWTREQRGDRAMDVNSGWRGWVGREGDREEEEEGRGKPDGRGDQQLVPSNKFHFQNCSKWVCLLSHLIDTLKYGKLHFSFLVLFFKNKDLNQLKKKKKASSRISGGLKPTFWPPGN